MREVLDLTLKSGRAGEPLTAFLVTPSGQETAQLPWPTEALEWQREWQRQFLAHHDRAGAPVSADAVGSFGANLQQALQDWLALPECRMLRDGLSDHPSAPLRLRLEGAASLELERLPWPLLSSERPCWLLEPTSQPPALAAQARARRPRVLLVVGDETGLRLDSEVACLSELARRRRVELRELRGAASNLSNLRQLLGDQCGWDLLVFLGHSEADPNGGGRLHLGDGSWVSGASFEVELQAAARRGLGLALFNSCSGLDLARSSVRSGLAWALCFRAPVPCQVASLAFAALIGALESGADLFTAVDRARAALEAEPSAVGGSLLLTLVGSPRAQGYGLPLRKRKQFLLRLARSTPRQAIAAAALVALAAAADVFPANPLSTYLLDRRLFVQRHWRMATGQPSPQRAPLPVLVLDQRSAEAIGAAATEGRVSRDLLSKVLQRVSPSAVPKVGLDVVLDESAPFTTELATVIRQQRRPLVVAGYFGPRVEAKRAGSSSMPLPVLQEAGLQARDLATGTPGLAGPLKWVPLQLWQPVTAANFAGALAATQARVMPADAVIDWSIDWRPLIRRAELSELTRLRAEALVLGTDGQLDRNAPDLFEAPGAMDPALTQIWQGAEQKLPGVLLQAVLAQSLSLGHWLTPASQALSTAAAAGLGVLVAALQASYRRRVLLVALIAALAMPLCWQLAIARLWLVPLALPLLGLAATALLRRD